MRERESKKIILSNNDEAWDDNEHDNEPDVQAVELKQSESRPKSVAEKPRRTFTIRHGATSSLVAKDVGSTPGGLDINNVTPE